MGTLLTVVAYGVYAAFWTRFLLHALLWWKAARRPDNSGPSQPSPVRTLLLTARDVILFWRLLKVNPSLWFGEWVFHVSFLLVMVRHLRFFLDPVPGWVWWAQTPGLIAGRVLPAALIFILAVRRFSEREKYSSPANMFLLCLLLAISVLGLLMFELYKPDIVTVKLFVAGILGFAPAAAPHSVLFLLHFSLVLVLVPLLPTHILTAPLVMLEARKRDLALPLVMHGPGED